MIFQLHEKHGKHIAYSPAEAEYNEKNGWKTVSKEKFYYVDVPDDNIEANDYHELVAEYETLFGRKPHGRMKLENIKKAIEDGKK
jgi:hypothetical protein